VEAFHFAAGGVVVGSGVLLSDVECVEEALVAVAAAPTPGEPGGEHRPVVGQCGGRHTVGFQGLRECVDDDRAGDSTVGGDRQGVAGVVVEPAQDLHILAGPTVGTGELVVGEVGLPRLVGLLGDEPDVGGAGAFARVRSDQAVGGEVPGHGGARDRDVMVVLQVPADCVGPGVEALRGELLA
jgi:hypothetical protein